MLKAVADHQNKPAVKGGFLICRPADGYCAGLNKLFLQIEIEAPQLASAVRIGYLNSAVMSAFGTKRTSGAATMSEVMTDTQREVDKCHFVADPPSG